MRSIVLARHGESVFSAIGVLNGDVSVSGGLTPQGVEQARALGGRLRDVPLDLVVTSALERAIVTADEATRGSDLPRLVLPELNDPLYGRYENARIEEYRAWAGAFPSSESPGEGGESRYAILERYARAYRTLLERPEESILAVSHSLPIAYALTAREGRDPSPRMPFAEYATPYPFTAQELARVVEVLERWLTAPTF
ncbi:MAG TPA: histidine phosphatase family protein [Gaiellaceae bacterium]